MRNFGVQVNGGAGDAGTFSAEDANSLMREGENLVTAGGDALNDADDMQSAQSVTRHVAAADFYIATGAANAFTLTQLGTFDPPSVLINGMRVRFVSNQNVTGAATVTIAGIGGALNLRKKNPNGTDNLTNLVSGDIVIGTYVEAIYRAGVNEFEVVIFDTVTKNGWRVIAASDTNLNLAVSQHKTLVRLSTASGGTFNVNLPQIAASPNGLEFMVRKETTNGMVNVVAFAGDDIGQPPPASYANNILMVNEGEMMHLVGSGSGNTRWVIPNRTAPATVNDINTGAVGYRPVTAEFLGQVPRSLINLSYVTTVGSGYQQMPGTPFLIQFGVANIAALSTGLVSFPISFPTSVLHIGITSFTAGLAYYRISNNTLLNFNWQSNAAITGTFRWLAIGY